MLIFRDIFSGKECLCDNGRALKVEGPCFVVQGVFKKVGGEDFGLAANADEDADEGATAEGTADKSEKVVDVEHDNRLQQTSYDKASYMAYIKGYMKALMEKMKEAGADEEYIKKFQTDAAAFVKMVVKDIDNFEYFCPEGDDIDFDTCTVILKRWETREGDNEEKMYFYYWKDGLKSEKV